MAIWYILFLIAAAILVLDSQQSPADKKIRAWKTGRIKLILGCWTITLGSSVVIGIHFWSVLF